MLSKSAVFESGVDEVVPDAQVRSAIEECRALQSDLAAMPAHLDSWMSGADRRARADRLLAKFEKAVEKLLAALQNAGSRPAQASLLPLAQSVKKCSDSLERLLSYTQQMGTNRGDTIHFLISYNQEE